MRRGMFTNRLHGESYGLNASRQVRPRKSLGQEQLDLCPGLVFRGAEQLLCSVRTQMRGQRDDCAEMETPIRQRREDSRELSRMPRCMDALGGDVFGEVKLA